MSRGFTDAPTRVKLKSERIGRPSGLRAGCRMQEIKIDLWHNDEALDWSIEINGLRHEHVTSEIMETLVECAFIVAENSLTRAVTGLLQ
jgi:hypothetical protein